MAHDATLFQARQNGGDGLLREPAAGAKRIGDLQDARPIPFPKDAKDGELQIRERLWFTHWTVPVGRGLQAALRPRLITNVILQL